MRVPQLILNALLAPALIIGATLMVNRWIANKPPPRSRPVPVVIPKVAVLDSRAAEHAPAITSFGNIRPFQQAQLASQVAGKITFLSESFQAGESVQAGEVLVTLDEADFLAEVESQKAAVATAERTLAEEESRSRIALEDWIDTGRRPGDAPDFTLRKPQLAAARATLAAATATLAQANLDLDRTRIAAPFDAIVEERSAGLGNVITSNTVLGSLIDRRRSEVRLPLTPEQAARLELPASFTSAPADADAKPATEQPLLAATLHTPSQPGISWTAILTRTEPALDPANQVLFIIAEVVNPFDDPEAFLPIGAYVEATIIGKPLPDVHRLPESALLEDRYVWILDGENTLRPQPVQRLFSADGHFLARITEPVTPEPLRVVTRPLVSFVNGDKAVPLEFESTAP